MIDRKTFLNKDLGLKVSPSCDPKRFDTSKYEDFLDALCQDREYQKEGIRETTRYLLGGEYRCLKDLAEENYRANEIIQEKYSSMDDFFTHLQLPYKLACSLDHATATGKSYVIYGIARILLAEGAVDQVLVLCPSNTIQDGLTAKFRVLSADRDLKDLLPDDSKTLNPSIINASSTIEKGDICVENIHATYLRTKSSIEDSLVGRGDRTLVVNDEAHHIMNPSDAGLKKWKEFLLDRSYGFRFIVNLSGTCYVKDDYFTDVIHRFALKDAMENGFVKLVRYVAEDSSGNEEEKFQKIYDNHIENKTVKYRKIKPITILITKDINACERLKDRLIAFLATKEDISEEIAAKRVLIVTSSQKHRNNIPLLQGVDARENPIEWITSVSMLTEGWDVKNVFQIVPHEERAFKSKLLIAQVLGRGLRIPEAYRGEKPVVTVFNHDRWSKNIKHLVDEVLEIEKRIHSYPVEKEPDYNFDLHTIKYKRIEEEVEYPQAGQYKLLKKGYVTYASQPRVIEKSTTYVTHTRGRDEKKTLVEFKMYSVDEAANEVVNKFKAIDMDLGTNYSDDFSFPRVREIIKESLRRIGVADDAVSESNLQKTLQVLGVVRRKKAKRLRITRDAKEILNISTNDANASSIGVAALRKDSTVFWDDDSLRLGEEADISLLKELDEDETLQRSSIIRVDNKYDFKTPYNVALAASAPERGFVKGLIKSEVAKEIDAWIKSPDVGFYGIEYSWSKGGHSKQASFNPDYFVKMGSDILVVEIKTDTDVTAENKAKLRYAREHFARVNKRQNDRQYYFKFLSPISYDQFFTELKNHRYREFRSELEAKLDEQTNNK
jgi:type III restriction enzyme